MAECVGEYYYKQGREHCTQFVLIPIGGLWRASPNMFILLEKVGHAKTEINQIYYSIKILMKNV